MIFMKFVEGLVLTKTVNFWGSLGFGSLNLFTFFNIVQ